MTIPPGLSCFYREIMAPGQLPIFGAEPYALKLGASLDIVSVGLEGRMVLAMHDLRFEELEPYAWALLEQASRIEAPKTLGVPYRSVEGPDGTLLVAPPEHVGVVCQSGVYDNGCWGIGLANPGSVLRPRFKSRYDFVLEDGV